MKKPTPLASLIDYQKDLIDWQKWRAETATTALNDALDLTIKNFRDSAIIRIESALQQLKDSEQ